MTTTPTWPDPYARGSHCFSTMLANLTKSTECEMTEELAYLVGCGLGFMFHRHGERYLVNSRNHDLEHHFARHIGGRLQIEAFAEFDDAIARLQVLATARHRPFAYCRAHLLPAFQGIIPWHKVRSTGEHALPIREVREDGVLANDYLWGHAMVVDAADLRRAMRGCPGDGFELASPARALTIGWLELPPSPPPLRWLVLLAIADNLRRYFELSTSTQGERALRSFERALSSMPSLLDVDIASAELDSIATTLELIGTGGGAGRLLYGRGLGEAGRRLGDPVLEGFGTRMVGLGGAWRRFGRELARRAGSEDPFAEWESVVLGIRDLRRRESALATELRAHVRAELRSAVSAGD